MNIVDVPVVKRMGFQFKRPVKMEANIMTDEEVRKIFEDAGRKPDPRFDPFFEFLREKRILSKLSCHNVQQIFHYFKENWRPE